MENIQIKSNTPVDIVFCVDFSGSMTDVIDGVRDHIDVFLDALDLDPENVIDWRIGFVGQSCCQLDIKKFTTDKNDFSNSLRGLSTRGDEFTLPAIDWSLDFDFRKEAHKIIVVFTDESIETGCDPSFQRSKIDELIDKALTLHAKIFFFCAYDDGEYQNLHNQIGGGGFFPVSDKDFQSGSFTDVLVLVGKSISKSSHGNAQMPHGNVKKDIYGLLNNPNITINYL